MPINRAKVAESATWLAARRRGAAPAGPATLAQGIVVHVAGQSEAQARALVACWWPGWEVATLEALLAAGRTEAIAAHFHEPAPGRLGYVAAAGQLGVTRKEVERRVKLGLEALLAWLAARANVQTGQKVL